MTKNGETLKYRVGSLEKQGEKTNTKIDKVDSKVDKIMTNHLPHIQEDVASIKAKLSIFIPLLTGSLVGIILLLVERFL